MNVYLSSWLCKCQKINSQVLVVACGRHDKEGNVHIKAKNSQEPYIYS